jgi:hypothetical protein
MLRVTLLSIIALSITLSTDCGIMLSVTMLSVTMLSVTMLSVIMLCVILPSVSVIMVNVKAPSKVISMRTRIWKEGKFSFSGGQSYKTFYGVSYDFS